MTINTRHMVGNHAATFTPQDVIDIRMSMASARDAAKVYHAGVDSILRIRSGRFHGPLTDEQKAAKARREGTDVKPGFRLDDVMLIVGHEPQPGMLVARGMDRQEVMDAAHECAHGRLAHDLTPACGCWPGEALPVPRRLKPTPATPPVELARVA